MFATIVNSRRIVLTALAGVGSMLLTACTTLSLTAANLPAVFGSYEARRDLKYGALDRQALDVYTPKAANAALQPAKRPIVIFVHGGGWNSGSKRNYRFVAEALTSRDLVAVVPNYRLYPTVKFPAFVDDIAQAVVWVHEHAAEFGGDPNQLFLMGHSAGAQIAAMIAYNDDYLKRAGGQRTWLRGFVGLAGPYDFLPFKDAYLHDMFGPESSYPLSQPVNFVGDNAVPALLIHGEADTVVLPANSRSLASRMRKHGDRVVEKYYSGMSHTDVLAAFSIYFRGRRPVLGDIDAFVHSAT